MPRGAKSNTLTVETYTHKEKRKNNPPVGLVSTATDKLNGKTKYQHDPHIDPYLSWAGKQEGMTVEVQNVSLHIHERIDPARIIKGVLNKKEVKQLSLFEEPDENPPLARAVDFYKHNQGWANRLIAGDSALVMNSLLAKEGMAGKVQMVYFDPPYGIAYNSNFQPFTNKRDVKDGNDEDIPAEPEMIQAFRDTWELGLHSYLTHLRNRVYLARDLLNDTGSIFLQISDQNIHHAREILDEVFGAENFQAVITFRKTNITFATERLGGVCDYILWYAKNNEKKKFNRLFIDKEFGGAGATNYGFIELADGTRRRMTADEKRTGAFPQGSRAFSAENLMSSGATESCIFDFEFQGKVYSPVRGKSWKTNKAGMTVLAERNRLIPLGDDRLYFITYFDEYPITKLTNAWYDTRGEMDLMYVVQTAPTPIQRCLLMATDPGDLVLDISCGSGTTAYVAENWGRRWITCDTSRVAITLAKQRLMTAEYDYFELAHPHEGIRSGFKYKIVPHITLGSIANHEPAQNETLYDQPSIERNKIRVAGPFTVEAVPSLRVKPLDGNLPPTEVDGSGISRTGATARMNEWMDELKATGIRTIGGKILSFARIEPLAGTRFLHASAEILDENGENKIAYLSFGPDFGPMEQRQVEAAWNEAQAMAQKPAFLIYSAFHFDPEAAKDIDQMEWKGVTFLKAQMSVDLLTSDLRKKRSSNQSYWLIGQPDVEVKKQKDGKYVVKVQGFDYYDPTTGQVESKNSKNIAMWMLDTDYDERSLLPEQVFFPEGDPKRDWTKLKKALRSEINEELIEKYSGIESIPFSAGQNRKIAVKIVDNRGIESFVIKNLA